MVDLKYFAIIVNPEKVAIIANNGSVSYYRFL